MFVDEVVEPNTGRLFHRPTGGGIEFGEPARATIAREFLEEYGLNVKVGRQLGVLENMFTYNGQPGHEIVVIHEAELADVAAYEAERTNSRELAHVAGVWRSQEEEGIPLFPDDLTKKLTEWGA